MKGDMFLERSVLVGLGTKLDEANANVSKVKKM